MQGIIDGLITEGYEGLWLVSVNTYYAASSLDLYTPIVAGPVFQDTEGNPIHELLGGSSYDVWVVDGDGRVRFAHEPILLPSESELLEAELRYLAAEVVH